MLNSVTLTHTHTHTHINLFLGCKTRTTQNYFLRCKGSGETLKNIKECFIEEKKNQIFIIMEKLLEIIMMLIRVYQCVAQSYVQLLLEHEYQDYGGHQISPPKDIYKSIYLQVFVRSPSSTEILEKMIVFCIYIYWSTRILMSFISLVGQEDEHAEDDKNEFLLFQLSLRKSNNSDSKSKNLP